MRKAVLTVSGFFSRSRIGVLGYALLGYVAAYAVLSFVLPHGAGGGKALLDIGAVVPPLAGTLACFWAARSAVERRERWAWLFLSLSFAVSAFAEAIWAFYEIVLHVDHPIPSLADVGYLLFYPLALAGILLLMRRGGIRGITSVLDGLIFTLGVAGLWWQLLLDQSLRGTGDSLLTVVTIAYPFGDVLIVFALTSLVLSWKLDRVDVPALFILLGFIVNTVADVLYARLILDASYVTGSTVDWIWPLAYALMTLGALTSIRLGPRTRQAAGFNPRLGVVDVSRTRFLWALLPYLALPAAGWLLYLQATGHGRVRYAEFVTAFAIALLGLVMIRQFLTVLENRRLSRSLVDLSQELEVRVDRRTQELSDRTEQLDALNRVADALSRCMTTDDVLSVGLESAQAAAGSGAGVLWLTTEGQEPVIVAHEGVDEVQLELMAGLPSGEEPVRNIVASGVPGVIEGERLYDLASPGDEDPPALLVIPLLSRSHSLGALGLLLADASTVDEDRLQLMQSIGAQLGVALQQAREYDSARYLADRDSVTGLLNHRALHARLEQELRRARRAGRRFSIIMMDLDDFKLFNDTYGHLVGDEVLRAMADRLYRMMRGSDVPGRYGGDEFVLILPETGMDGAIEFAERLREDMADRPFLTPDGTTVPVFLSFGVATYPDHGHSATELLSFADTNLYVSKQHGGDTITAGPDAELEELGATGLFGVLDALVTAVDNRDRYTRRHSETVTLYALALGRQIGLSDTGLRALRIAGILHDVGKIGVPDRILRKPGRLTMEEQKVVKQHAALSELIVKEVPHLNEVVPAVGSHHERWDGAGYPRGLKGEEIPLLGRILAVADAYSAMTMDRPYRKALEPAAAQAQLVSAAGTQFDPTLVEAFVRVLDREKQAIAN